MTILATGWAVVLPDGDVIVDVAPGVTEADIWWIALGWPPPDEVASAKARGARAVRCEVREIGGEG